MRELDTQTSISSPSDSPFPNPNANMKPKPGMTDEEIKALQEKALHGKLVQWVRTEYDKCKAAHTPIRNQWYLNLSFYKGDQYTQIINGNVMKTRAPSRRVRMVINRVRPMIRTQLSQMTSQKPNAEVIPSSADIDAILAAEAGEAVYENVSAEYKLAERQLEAAFWQSTCGVGYIKTYWNPDNNDGEGTHEYSAPSPFHVLVPDLMVEDIEDQPYVLNVFTKPASWVKQNFGDIIPKDYKPTVIGTSEIMETQYLNVKQMGRGAEPDSSLIIEAWIKPGIHPDLPKGGLITILDSFVVQASLDGIPYEHGMFPFAKFDGIPSGSFYRTSAIEDFIQLQMELNRNRSQRVEARNLTSKPQWISPKGVIDVNKWRNEPGQVLEYTPGLGKPEVMPISSLPSYVIQEEDRLLGDMEDVSGQHQVSKGSNPSGVTSGTAISFLQEADNSFMATIFLSIESAMEKIAKQTLMIAVQFWDTPRLVKVSGNEGFSVKRLSGADIKDGTDIHMESGSSLPVSKAARTALFMDLMSKGALPADQALEMMNLPNMRAYYQRANVDKLQAQRENSIIREMNPEEVEMINQQVEQMKMETLAQLGLDEETARMSPQGGEIDAMFNEPIVKVNDYDNHEKHMVEHEFFMKSQSFESLDAVVREQFVKHWEAHRNKMQEGMLQELMGGGGGMPQQGGNPDGANQFSGMPPAGEEEQQGLDQEAPVQ